MPNLGECRFSPQGRRSFCESQPTTRRRGSRSLARCSFALIAAGTAQWRLNRQLSAEADRLGRQLEHGRQMSDTTDLRRVLHRTLDVYERRRELI